jgi:hypothetical protein
MKKYLPYIAAALIPLGVFFLVRGARGQTDLATVTVTWTHPDPGGLLFPLYTCRGNCGIGSMGWSEVYDTENNPVVLVCDTPQTPCTATYPATWTMYQTWSFYMATRLGSRTSEASNIIIVQRTPTTTTTTIPGLVAPNLMSIEVR